MAEITTQGDEVRVNMGEARQRLTDLVEMVQTGSRVFLMKRGVPVVEMIPAKDYSRERHTHSDDVSCQAAGDGGHPPRGFEVGQDLTSAREAFVAGPGFEPPPPPPPEDRPQKAPKPPRNREVSATVRQKRIDAILGNLGGKKSRTRG